MQEPTRISERYKSSKEITVETGSAYSRLDGEQRNWVDNLIDRHMKLPEEFAKTFYPNNPEREKHLLGYVNRIRNLLSTSGQNFEDRIC